MIIVRHLRKRTYYNIHITIIQYYVHREMRVDALISASVGLLGLECIIHAWGSAVELIKMKEYYFITTEVNGRFYFIFLLSFLLNSIALQRK